MATSSKRPEHLSWVSFVLSIVVFGTAFFVGRWSGFPAVAAIAWLALGCALIWFVLAIQFHQRSLAEQERLDMGQLSRDERAASIFQAKGEKAALFAVAQRRLELLEKWFLPIFAVIIAVYELVIGLYLLKGISAGSDVQPQQPLLCAIILTGAAFVSFLISRYATGMSVEPGWRPLRAGGSFLLGVAVLCFALAIGLALQHFHITVVVSVVDYVVPGLVIILGVETALNVVLDVYRPRVKGQYDRSAFDSRLLSIINEPGGILRGAASAIDYQFGFKVSQTWFYKLLEKAIVPLVLFGAATLYLMSCFVVIGPDEQAIIERLGNPLVGGNVARLAGPGLTIKWPWPIDKVYRHRTGKVTELNIGFVPKTDPKTGEVVREKFLLWGKTHYEQEYSVLVASQHGGQELPEGAVPIGIVKVNVPVHYRVKDLYAYLYNHSDPKKLLEMICYRELAKFMASAKVEVDSEQGEQTLEEDSLLGAGREKAKSQLTKVIQDAADGENLGIEIVFVGLQGVHPPPEVAPDYQAVVGAVQQKKASILEAEAERNTTLCTLAGSVQSAEELYSLAERYQQAIGQNKPADANALGTRLDWAFAKASGDIFKSLREAQSYAFDRATIARATGERFADQLKAYAAAKEIYKHEQRMAAAEKGLAAARKYVVISDPNDTRIFQVDVQEKLTPGLLDILPQSQESNEQ